MIGKKKASNASALARPPSPTPDAVKPAAVQKEESGVGDAYEGDVIALDLNPAAMSMDSPEPASQASKEDGAAPSRREGAGEPRDGKGEAKSEIQASLFLVHFLRSFSVGNMKYSACAFREISRPQLS
jgi:hypothetical protein